MSQDIGERMKAFWGPAVEYPVHLKSCLVFQINMQKKNLQICHHLCKEFLNVDYLMSQV